MVLGHMIALGNEEKIIVYPGKTAEGQYGVLREKRSSMWRLRGHRFAASSPMYTAIDLVKRSNIRLLTSQPL